MVPLVSSEATCHQGSLHHEPNNSETLPLVASRAMADLASSSTTPDPTKQLCKVTLNPFEETRQSVAVANNFFKLKIGCSRSPEFGIRVYLENSQNLFFSKDQLLGEFDRVKIKLSEKAAIEVHDSTLDATLRGNMLHGPVKIVGKDGSQWEGEFRDGRPWTGKGKVRITHSKNRGIDVHEGMWTNGRFIGKITLDSGKIFKGEFSEITWKRKKSCFLKGRVTHEKNCTNWGGEYRNGQPLNGEGRLINVLKPCDPILPFGEIVEEGTWTNGILIGKVTLNSRTTLEGQFWQGYPLIKITLSHQNGTAWEGLFLKWGCLNCESRFKVLKGPWFGEGKIVVEDWICEGRWIAGQFLGRMIHPSGKVCDGEILFASFAKEKEDSLFELNLRAEAWKLLLSVDFNGKITDIKDPSSSWEGNCYIHIDRKLEKPRASDSEEFGGNGDPWGSQNDYSEDWDGGDSWYIPDDYSEDWGGGINSRDTSNNYDSLVPFAEERAVPFAKSDPFAGESDLCGGSGPKVRSEAKAPMIARSKEASTSKATSANESIRFEPINGAGRLDFGDWIGDGQWKDGAFAEGQIITPSGKVLENEFKYPRGKRGRGNWDNWPSCPIRRYHKKGKVMDPDGST